MQARPVLWVWLSLCHGCAVLHHAQVGDIYNRIQARKPLEIKVSETGVNIKEAAHLAGKLGGSKLNRDAQGIASLLAYFQMEPRTGNPVYVSNYARKIVDQLWDQCPSGKITGLQSIREMRSYPVISGEIVKLKAECLSW